MTAPQKRGVKPHPALISKADFAQLATLAWQRDPMRPLSDQMAEATGVTIRSCQYWLNPLSERHPPPDIVQQAYQAAETAYEALNDVLDRSAAALKP